MGSPSDACGAHRGAQQLVAFRRPPGRALLLGCLAGLALSWQAILSEAARDRVYLVFTGLGYTATASAGQDRTGTEGRRPIVEGMAGTRERQSEKPLAVWPEFAAGFTMGLDTRSPDPLPLKSLGSPDRLELAEETGLADERAAEVGAPAVAMDITFDVNSSFLPPDAVDALRELVHRLPVTGSRRWASRPRSAIPASRTAEVE